MPRKASDGQEGGRKGEGMLGYQAEHCRLAAHVGSSKEDETRLIKRAHPHIVWNKILTHPNSQRSDSIFKSTSEKPEKAYF